MTAQPLSRTPPRLAFAGLGWIGRNRMEAALGGGRAELAAVCDPWADLGNEPAAVATFEELLVSAADGIVIATPSALHAGQAVAALEAGKAVFCQKPLGRNAAETRRVIEAAKTNDLLLGVDLSYRFTDAMSAVRKLVTDGEIGQVFSVDLVFHNAYGPDKPWFYDASLAGGGCVIDLGIHLVDAALWTLGFPAVEGVHGRLFRHGGHPVEDFAVATIDLAGGTVARLACSWNLSAGQDCVIEASFYGTTGAAVFRNIGGSFYDFVAEHRVKTSSRRLTEPGDPWGGRAIARWVERLGESRAYDPAIEAVADVAAVLDRIYASAEEATSGDRGA